MAPGTWLSQEWRRAGSSRYSSRSTTVIEAGAATSSIIDTTELVRGTPNRSRVRWAVADTQMVSRAEPSRIEPSSITTMMLTIFWPTGLRPLGSCHIRFRQAVIDPTKPLPA